MKVRAGYAETHGEVVRVDGGRCMGGLNGFFVCAVLERGEYMTRRRDMRSEVKRPTTYPTKQSLNVESLIQKGHNSSSSSSSHKIHDPQLKAK